MSEVLERVAAVETEIGNLKDWQKRQNGTLNKLDTKVENLYRIAVGTLVAVLGTLAAMVGNLVIKV